MLEIACWEEAAVNDERHRHFYYWCTNCRSTMHLETAELKADDERNVDDGPWGNEPSCPMCEVRMEDWDDIAAHDEEFRNKGTFEDSDRWREKLKEGCCDKKKI